MNSSVVMLSKLMLTNIRFLAVPENFTKQDYWAGQGFLPLFLILCSLCIKKNLFKQKFDDSNTLQPSPGTDYKKLFKFLFDTKILNNFASTYDTLYFNFIFTVIILQILKRKKEDFIFHKAIFLFLFFSLEYSCLFFQE